MIEWDTPIHPEANEQASTEENDPGLENPGVSSSPVMSSNRRWDYGVKWSHHGGGDSDWEEEPDRTKVGVSEVITDLLKIFVDGVQVQTSRETDDVLESGTTCSHRP